MRSVYLGLIVCGWLLCQSVFGQRYNFTRYSLEEGLPRSGVYSLFEDKDGFLWIGTEGGGVTVFDGLSFTTFTKSDGLPNDVIRVVYQDSEGDMWLGAQADGVGRYDGNQFTSIGFSPDAGNYSIRTIVEDHQGNLWFGTIGGGVFHYTVGAQNSDTLRQKWTTVNGLSHNNVRVSLCDSRGRVWFGTDDGVTIVAGDSLRYIKKADGLPSKRILTMFEDRQQRIWLGTSSGAVMCTDDTLRVYAKKDGLVSNRVRAISQDVTGDLWFGTKEGVSRFDGTHFQTFTERNGLSNNRIRSILSDSYNNLWFGTYFGGICRFDGDRFLHFFAEDGLVNNQITSVTQDSKGTIWLGSLGGVNLLEKDTTAAATTPYIMRSLAALRGQEINAIKEGQDGEMWFATGYGLHLWKDEKHQWISQPEGLNGESVYSLLEDTNGVWAGTNVGLSFVSAASGKIEVTNQPININGSSEVGSLYRDKNDRIWLGLLDGGLAVFDNDSIYTIDILGIEDIVNVIVGDDKGRVFVGTEGGGIYCFNSVIPEEGKYNYYSLDKVDGLASHTASLLIFDSEGDLWVGSEKGLDRLHFDEKGEVQQIRHFGRGEGFTGIETNRNASCIDNEGKLWFGTIKGVSRYNLAGERLNSTPPYTYLTDLRLHGNQVNWDRSPFSDSIAGRFHLPHRLHFPHDENSLSFYFLGVNLTAPSKVKYSWILEGLEDNWSNPEARQDVAYASIPPGDYVFRVKAYNEDLVAAEEGIALRFSIATPYWRTWWFFAGCTALAVLGFVLFVKIRERNLVRERKRLQKMVDERTAEVVREKKKSDELLLNILPQETADELKANGKATVRNYDSVSVLFTDFVGFTRITEKISHPQLIAELDRHFRKFDEIMEHYGLEKIKTIGDAYMCAGGIPVVDDQNAIKIVLAAFEMQDFVRALNAQRIANDEHHWNLRLGIASGPVITGVVGKKKFAYDIWGDTVNTASRMESGSEPGKVNVSGSTYRLISDYFDCSHRGKIEAKNKGEINMYFVDGIKEEYTAEDGRSPGKKLLQIIGVEQEEG